MSCVEFKNEIKKNNKVTYESRRREIIKIRAEIKVRENQRGHKTKSLFKKKTKQKSKNNEIANLQQDSARNKGKIYK